MVEYKDHQLTNGLRLIFNEDKTTPIVAFNLLYDVGSKDEDENKTGFAHLFEHLMFGGSINIPSFDGPLQTVGGENNAFTSTDMTNYYITLPKNNIETAFWLESDRMLSLAFSDKSLEVQRQVVIEEFAQRYLNQPYGDVYLLLRPLAYKKHPYRWATIGKEIKHIETATMDDVKAFFKRHYYPGNAILSISGDLEFEEVKRLTEKWFGDIPSKKKVVRNLPLEPLQKEERVLEVERDVPLNALYYAYHMPSKNDADYYAVDLLSDVISRGDSSRFYERLLKKTNLFAEIDAFVTGDMETGLFIISAKLSEGVTYEEAEAAIDQELLELVENRVEVEELKKVKNKAEATFEFGKTSALNKAMGLAICALVKEPELFNYEFELYDKVSVETIQRVAKNVLRKENRSKLIYKAKKV
ncbi:insulinase family protein [Vicingaceae bacterium]|nr:insulinase family protein [Vicingaceae bacterium]